MRKHLMAAATALALGLAGASAADAATYISKLEYKDGGSGVQGPLNPYFGQVKLEELDANTVKVTVSLNNANSLFLNTGGPHEPFLFNLTSPANSVTISNDLSKGQNFYYAGHDADTTTAPNFSATPFGNFSDKVGCCSTWVPEHQEASGWHWGTEQVVTGYKIIGYEKKGNGQPNLNKPIYDYNQPIYGTKQVKVTDYVTVPGHYVENNGAANGIPGDLVFTVFDADGLTFAGLGAVLDKDTGKLLAPGTGTDNHFISNDGGWWFTADIYDGNTGLTYNVAARDAFGPFTPACVGRTCDVGGVPEPNTWALMITGFGALGAMLRRRRAAAAA